MERGNKTLRCVQGKWIGVRPVCRGNDNRARFSGHNVTFCKLSVLVKVC